MNRRAFTLIELLVVIAIIAILSAILFPVFTQAKTSAKFSNNISNLRQVSLAVMLYADDNGGYPMMSSASGSVPRMRWPDYIYPYAKSTEIFYGPLTPKEMQGKTFAHDPEARFGGYGYNYQYLGNSRIVPGDLNFPFTAKDSEIEATSLTVVVADTQGVRNDAGEMVGGDYTIDPPLSSSRGSGRPTGFYAKPEDCGSGIPKTPGQFGCRSTPAEWAFGKVTVAFADGHAKTISRIRLDDSNGDGQPDNGHYNLRGDHSFK